MQEYLTFVTSVGAWVIDEQNIDIKPKEYVFTVNDSGKKVKFSPGNLYWNGSEFRCEAKQYDFPTAWDENHVGHFFWSKDARVAYALNYNEANTAFGITPSETDTFFAADGGAIEGWTVLSKDEWEYLIDHSLAACNDRKNYFIDVEFDFTGTYAEAKAEYDTNYDYLKETYGEFDEAIANGYIEAWDCYKHTVNGINCVILKPDGFSGTVADTYTASEWAEAEAAYGFVAVPFAGYRSGTDFGSAGNYGNYWSSTLNIPCPWGAYFSDRRAGIFDDGDGRSEGYSVRLVKVMNPGD